MQRGTLCSRRLHAYALNSYKEARRPATATRQWLHNFHTAHGSGENAHSVTLAKRQDTLSYLQTENIFVKDYKNLKPSVLVLLCDNMGD